MFIVKLGGSVITDKSKVCCFKKETMDKLSSQLKKASKKFILVHGAGSFGHITAEEFKLNKGYVEGKQLMGFSLTHAQVQKLNNLVLESLHQTGIPAVSIPPHIVLRLDNHLPLSMNYKIFEDYLERGFVPLTYGDVVLDKKLGFSICSGDLMVELLSKYFKPRCAVFVIDVDGLYTSNPKKDKKANFIGELTAKELDNITFLCDNHADVTRGMRGKIDTIKRIAMSGVKTILVNGNVNNRVFYTLVGKNTKCTIVYGERK
jgi:isopentenyl phosphate kinase